MGCNAWNHALDCDCGWGGAYHGESSGIARAFIWEEGEDYTYPNARCPYCKASVFFVRPTTGGAVYFDHLGPPWPKHPCTDNYNRVPTKQRHPDPDKSWTELPKHTVYLEDGKRIINIKCRNVRKKLATPHFYAPADYCGGPIFSKHSPQGWGTGRIIVSYLDSSLQPRTSFLTPKPLPALRRKTAEESSLLLAWKIFSAGKNRSTDWWTEERVNQLISHLEASAINEDPKNGILAAIALGNIYREGFHHIPKWTDKARHWYRWGAWLGDERCKKFSKRRKL